MHKYWKERRTHACQIRIRTACCIIPPSATRQRSMHPSHNTTFREHINNHKITSALLNHIAHYCVRLRTIREYRKTTNKTNRNKYNHATRRTDKHTRLHLRIAWLLPNSQSRAVTAARPLSLARITAKHRPLTLINDHPQANRHTRDFFCVLERFHGQQRILRSVALSFRLQNNEHY